MTNRELERLLDLLAKLFEELPADQGALRDEISRVRAHCWGLLEVSA
jgi:hypothetical protein